MLKVSHPLESNINMPLLNSTNKIEKLEAVQNLDSLIYFMNIINLCQK